METSNVMWNNVTLSPEDFHVQTKSFLMYKIGKFSLFVSSCEDSCAKNKMFAQLLISVESKTGFLSF